MRAHVEASAVDTILTLQWADALRLKAAWALVDESELWKDVHANAWKAGLADMAHVSPVHFAWTEEGTPLTASWTQPRTMRSGQGLVGCRLELQDDNMEAMMEKEEQWKEMGISKLELELVRRMKNLNCSSSRGIQKKKIQIMMIPQKDHQIP